MKEYMRDTEWMINPRFGIGVPSPNKRTDGDHYDHYVIMGSDGLPCAFQHDGMRYPFSPIWRTQGLANYIIAEPSVWAQESIAWAQRELARLGMVMD